ncbi:MAG: DUF1616 domain-containing protein [Candidatus Dormibacteria bacterium]
MVTAVSAIVCSSICATVSLAAVNIVFGCALVLYLPGAALVAAARAASDNGSRSEQLWWSVLASVGITILGGLMLNELGGLTRIHWVIYLGAVTIGACSVAWWRLGRNWKVWGLNVRVNRLAVTSYRSILVTLVAVLVVTAAIGVSEFSAVTANREDFTQLWLLPSPVAAGDYAGHFEVGIQNHEGRTVTLDVVVRLGTGVLLAKRRVELADGSSWKKVMIRPKRQTVTATVAFDTSPGHILSTVRLSRPS